MSELLPGRYRHYKGKEYTVLGVARHSESMEELVVYRPEYGEQGLWVRPKTMFLETVRVDGQEVRRFEPLDCVQDGQVDNLFRNLPQHLPAELVETLAAAGQVRIDRILSQGHASPEDFWYDQDQHEWVVLLRGAARLRFEDGMITLMPGDHVNIPRHKRHRVEWTSPAEPTVWLAVHYGEFGAKADLASSPAGS